MALYRFDTDFSQPWNRDALQRPDGTVWSGGCVRLDPVKGCYIHSNTAHINYGLAACWISEGDGNLYIDQQFNGPIVTMSAGADETIAGKKGIMCGPSSGTSLIVVTFWSTKEGRTLNLANASDYAKVASTGSNVWVESTQAQPIPA